MSLVVSIKAEFLKTRRTSSIWVAVLGAGFIPFIYFLNYAIRAKENLEKLGDRPWEIHFLQLWQAFASFLLPMFVILICSQIPQIEYKNNTWKQVFSSPQRASEIYFSKLIAVFRLVIILLVLFNAFMILAGIAVNVINPNYKFIEKNIPWDNLVRLNLKTFVALLGIISIQYWLGLSSRNFMVAIGSGLALLITAIILASWEHVDKFPYAFAFLTFGKEAARGASKAFFYNHELYSIGFFILFTVTGFLHLNFRKKRG